MSEMNGEVKQNWNPMLLTISGVVITVILAILIIKSPKFLEDYSGTVSLISLLVAIFMFFYQQERDKEQAKQELNDRIRRFCVTLQNDAKQIKKEIMEGVDKVKSKKGKVSTTVYLSTKIYDSLIYSGLIGYLLSQTQGNLDNLYYKIERNNDNIRRRTDIVIRRDLTPDIAGTEILEVIDKFHELISDYQKEIIELLDKVENDLSIEISRL